MQPRYILLPLALTGLLAACLPAAKPKVPTGAEDFASFCAACHGAWGTGDGVAAAALAKKPADLTRLSAGNGGRFPTARVMSKIYGYTGQPADALMPDFGSLLEGETVLYDTGDGIPTPTPLRLVQLAEHVRALQK